MRAIVVRAFADADLRQIAAAATVPVINALSDGHDPCQTLAGLLTLR
ncbi:MAG TPA: ornithine carbamoyltransferase, partial [Actinomycetes bacterium]|nr:ornithine carbamoyltransferase [Actinomycetes bacterium]